MAIIKIYNYSEYDINKDELLYCFFLFELKILIKEGFMKKGKKKIKRNSKRLKGVKISKQRTRNKGK